MSIDEHQNTVDMCIPTCKTHQMLVMNVLISNCLKLIESTTVGKHTKFLTCICLILKLGR